MILDRCMPDYHSREIHSILVAGPPEQVYPFVRHLDFRSSWITRLLFSLRGMPTNRMTLDSIVGEGGLFRIIAEADFEFVVAGIGRPGGKTMPFSSEAEFQAVKRPGLIKICWNFTLSSEGEKTRVRTETRIQSTDRKTRIIFFFYWIIVRPFSGLIRREMLRIVKKQAMATRGAP